MSTQTVHQFAQEGPLSEPTTMTLEEFLESDLEGYEYVEGELVPMPPTSMEHGDISVNLFFPLGSYVRENQLGRVYMPDTGFRVGERVLMPDIAFVSTDRLPADLSKPVRSRQTSPLRWFLQQTRRTGLRKKRLPTLRQVHS